VEIFAEEVVRGGPAFAISLVISAIEPTLRQLAELGAWQVWAAVGSSFAAMSSSCAVTVACHFEDELPGIGCTRIPTHNMQYLTKWPSTG